MITYSRTGSSDDPIWFDNIDCSEFSDVYRDVNCLTDCQQCPSSQNHNCVHSEDVTLRCSMLKHDYNSLFLLFSKQIIILF